ncbi:hypothetical protein HUJ05_010042 [Dendroctonus ponderosae]|nr:hypothetical protein HUJ05_010042 [Dendroctonus ponderosae]
MVSDTFLGPPISIPCFCHQAQLISVPVVAFIASTLADNTEESETKMFFEMASCKPENKQCVLPELEQDMVAVRNSINTAVTAIEDAEDKFPLQRIRMHSRSHFEMVTTTKVITDNGVLSEKFFSKKPANDQGFVVGAKEKVWVKRLDSDSGRFKEIEGF